MKKYDVAVDFHGYIYAVDNFDVADMSNIFRIKHIVFVINIHNSNLWIYSYIT